MAERTNGQIIFGTLIAVVIGAFIGWAGGDGGDQYQGVAVFAICAALAFAIKHMVSPRKLGDPQYIVWRHGGAKQQ